MLRAEGESVVVRVLTPRKAADSNVNVTQKEKPNESTSDTDNHGLAFGSQHGFREIFFAGKKMKKFGMTHVNKKLRHSYIRRMAQ